MHVDYSAVRAARSTVCFVDSNRIQKKKTDQRALAGERAAKRPKSPRRARALPAPARVAFDSTGRGALPWVYNAIFCGGRRDGRGGWGRASRYFPVLPAARLWLGSKPQPPYARTTDTHPNEQIRFDVKKLASVAKDADCRPSLARARHGPAAAGRAPTGERRMRGRRRGPKIRLRESSDGRAGRSPRSAPRPQPRMDEPPPSPPPAMLSATPAEHM